MIHSGSCHCGRVRFTAELDFSAGSVRCNCSICTKGRMWLAVVPPHAFTVTGDDVLNTYEFGGRVRHHFCTVCGIKPFGEVTIDEGGDSQGLGSEGLGIAVNLACLDDVTPDDWAAIAIHYVDGRADHFDRAPAVTAYL